MTLKYKILWIDNDDSIYLNHQDDIESYLDNLGFEPIILKGKDYNAFNDYSEMLNEIDLFILDYKLDKVKDENGNDKIINGNKIISEIRNDKLIYTDVIFYSGVPDDMRKKAYDDKLSGVYFTSRSFEDFEEDVLGVINVTIKRVQDINNLRGLIMSEVAELDRIKNNIIQKFNKDVDSSFKKYIKEDVFSKIREELEDLKYIIKVEDSDYSHDEINLEELQKNFFYDSFKKSRTVFKVKRLKEKCREIPFVHNNYYNEVIKKRNVLAHEEEKTRVDGSKYLNYPNGTPLEFNEEHCIQIRKDIRKYKKLLLEIEQKLNE